VRYDPTPFPPYAYLPGRDPHPVRDPRGHSFEAEPSEPPAIAVDPAAWRDCVAYLHGVDLYNHGYLWEAHEAWEGPWRGAELETPQHAFLQGLIQCAAACLKVTMGEPRGTARLTEAATARLESVVERASPTYMGLELIPFIAAMRAFAASEPTDAEARPRIDLA